MLKLAEVLSGWRPAEGCAQEPIVLLEAGWDEIVGNEVARNSRPVRVADATLIVVTRSSAWSHQLSFLADHVLRAVAARLPEAGIEQLRFRVGRIPERARPSRHRGRAGRRDTPRAPAPESSTEALARFRRDVEESTNARRAAGWQECADCGAMAVAARGELCSACAAAHASERTAATARLLFEAPWLGYAGTAALINGLQEDEYEHIRTGLLKQWWGTLAQARAGKRLSRDGRERLVASSYVVLKSRLPPEEIISATVRSILGDELHQMLYGEPHEGGTADDRKRRG